jgi:hypothetical protein
VNLIIFIKNAFHRKVYILIFIIERKFILKPEADQTHMASLVHIKHSLEEGKENYYLGFCDTLERKRIKVIYVM